MRRLIDWLNEELAPGERYEPPLRRWAVLAVDLCALIIGAGVITLIIMGV